VKALVTGAAGQVGQALLRAAPADVELAALARSELDISDAAAVRSAVAAIAPDVILNAAAYTAVDRAEAEPERASSVNVAGARHLAEAAAALPACRLLHLSTDYVFDGRSTRAYLPSDATGPLGVYGASKLAGEQAALHALGARCLIVRTAWVYAATGSNFLLTMLRLMRERGAVRVVADQIGTPSAAAPLAELLWRLAGLPAERASGVLHWTDAGVASWYDFAVAIAEEGAAAGLLPAGVAVSPITTAEYPTPAARPAFSLLDGHRTWELANFRPGHWRVRLRETLACMRPRS
jgi:dTDP-4-dehydrorhamnose reductase